MPNVKPLTRREIVLARAAAVARSGGKFVFGRDLQNWLNAQLLWDVVDLAEDVRKAGAVLLIDEKRCLVEALAKYAARREANKNADGWFRPAAATAGRRLLWHFRRQGHALCHRVFRPASKVTAAVVVPEIPADDRAAGLYCSECHYQRLQIEHILRLDREREENARHDG
jgi:hypothetical protein